MAATQTGSILGAQGIRLAQRLQNNAVELEQIAGRMRAAADILNGRAQNRLSAAGRAAISKAARRRWARARREQAKRQRELARKKAKSQNQRV